MFEIIAGQSAEGYRFEVESVLDERELPAHVDVVAAAEVDVETYAEGELTDAELLALAAEDAMEAQRGGRLAGPELDEVALRRSERRARAADVARVLRTHVEGAIA